MLPGDERYYEQGLRLLQAENDRLRAVVDRVATDLETHQADGGETPTLSPDELRAVLEPGMPAPVANDES